MALKASNLASDEFQRGCHALFFLDLKNKADKNLTVCPLII
jgi:hypothetical protein